MDTKIQEVQLKQAGVEPYPEPVPGTTAEEQRRASAEDVVAVLWAWDLVRESVRCWESTGHDAEGVELEFEDFLQRLNARDNVRKALRHFGMHATTHHPGEHFGRLRAGEGDPATERLVDVEAMLAAVDVAGNPDGARRGRGWG